MTNNNFSNIKQILKLDISDDILLRILFDTNKYFDKKLTIAYKTEQKTNNRIFNSIERKSLRNYFYYETNEDLYKNNILSFPSIKYNEEDINNVCEDVIYRLKTYDENKIISSIQQKYKNLVQYKMSSISHKDEWLNYYNEKRSKLFGYSAFILRLSNEDFIEHNYNESYIYDIIASTYEKLENYRYLFVVVDGQIFDENKNDITWKLISHITIYTENFVQYKEKYFPCKKSKQIKILQDFIDTRFSNNTNHTIASDFYKNISTGFKYEDCFVSDNQNMIIISLKKITRDESAVPCPSCMTTIQSGNSYPEMFLRSFECKNDSCQDRSKSGRGKRFDEYGVYRSFKLEENHEANKVSNALYTQWRRDIFDNELSWIEMIVKYYTWDNEQILTYNFDQNELFNRKFITFKTLNSQEIKFEYIKTYEELPIVILYNSIARLLNNSSGTKDLKDDIAIVNDESSSYISSLKAYQIGTAITSPPYYNAREYSQWQNLLLYLIDMMINAKSIYTTLSDKGRYLYNIGDIVSEDNVYVNSNMSKRRLPLGFLSCMIFELVGFNLIENIIWDKGEVQSKRNSTINLFSGYVKCINCYEHVFVFAKNDNGTNNKLVKEISPVIKINSKGENTYKHTAPYPLELVNLIEPYIMQGKYILDPYLGSGTTLKWCKQHGHKGIGIELNKEYYELARQNIKDKKED